MQETRVWSLVWKDLTCLRVAEPICHNHWACALEPGNHSYWAHVQRLLKSMCPRAHAPEEKQTARSLHTVPAEQSLLATLETSLQQHRPRTAKNKAKRTNHAVDATLRFGEKILIKGTQHFSTGRGAHPSGAYTWETASKGEWTWPKSCQSVCRVSPSPEFPLPSPGFFPP